MKTRDALCLLAFVGCVEHQADNPGPDDGAAALMGSWHDAQDPTKLLRFEPDGTYFDSAFDDWAEQGYHCAGKYTLDGYVLTLEETCPQTTAPTGEALPCRYIKDVLAVAATDGSLSVTSFHRADGSTDLVGDWHHHTERWRQIDNEEGSCEPTLMEETDNLALGLASDGAFTYSVTTKAWNVWTQQYDLSQKTKTGTYQVSGAQVVLDGAPILPIHLLGNGLAPGEKLYARD